MRREAKGRYIKVRARRLDDILEELSVQRIDLVKIDVEGAEMEVLHGMKRSLLAISLDL